MKTVTNSLLGKQFACREIFLLFLVLSTGYFYASSEPEMLVIFFIGAVSIGCLIMIFKIEDPFLRYILVAALFLRLVLIAIQAYTDINLPGAGVDSETFEKYAWKNARYWLGYGEAGKYTGAYYYSALIGLIYLFFGRIPVIAQFVNVLFSLLAIYYLYKIAFLVSGSKRTARIAALVFMLIPSLNAYSAILLRESIIIFFAILSFYFFTEWTQKGNIRYIAGSFVAVALAGAFHGPMFLLIWVLIFFLVIYSPKEKRFRIVKSQVLIAVAVVALSFVLLSDVITYQLPGNLGRIITPDFMRSVVERKPIGRTTFMQGIVPYTYFDLLWQTPLRVLHFMFAPFPWALETKRDIFGLIDVLLYSGLIYYAVNGVRRLKARAGPAVMAAILILGSLVIMFSWGTTNYGTAWRHRQKLAPYLVVLASAGVAASSRWNWLLPELNGACLGREKNSLERGSPLI